MGLEDTIWLGGSIQIVPEGLGIMASDNQVISKRMNIKTGDRSMSKARNHLSHKLLTNQVINPDCLASSNDKVRLNRVECNRPDSAGHLLEGPLALTSRKLVDGDNCLLVLSRGYRSDGGEVITTSVPTDRGNFLCMINREHDALGGFGLGQLLP